MKLSCYYSCSKGTRGTRNGFKVFPTNTNLSRPKGREWFLPSASKRSGDSFGTRVINEGQEKRSLFFEERRGTHPQLLRGEVLVFP
jgi:hypothetical protein